MRTMAFQSSRRFIVSLCLMVLLAVNLVIVSSPTQNLSALLQSTEAKERRAVKETWCEWDNSVGVVWGFAAVQIPLWLSVAVFFMASDLAERRSTAKAADSFLWICCLVLAVSGCLMFLLTGGEKFGVLGPSLYRYSLLILSALPAGVLSTVVSREERWATPVPTLLGFVIVAFCIAGSDFFNV
jgi:hypothetical protein